jgi:hypothetical protein
VVFAPSNLPWVKSPNSTWDCVGLIVEICVGRNRGNLTHARAAGDVYQVRSSRDSAMSPQHEAPPNATHAVAFSFALFQPPYMNEAQPDSNPVNFIHFTLIKETP